MSDVVEIIYKAEIDGFNKSIDLAVSRGKKLEESTEKVDENIKDATKSGSKFAETVDKAAKSLTPAQAAAVSLAAEMRRLERATNRTAVATAKQAKNTSRLDRIQRDLNRRWSIARDRLTVLRNVGQSAFRGTRKEMDAASKSGQGFNRIMRRLLGAVTAFAAVRLGRQALDDFDAQEKAIGKVEQALTSTGGAAGRTLDQLRARAIALQEGTIFGDEQILDGVTSQLLTFTRITGEQFDRTQEAALNLSTVIGGGLRANSIRLGKALNDPVANLGELGRSGIQFTKAQQAVIKELAETNRLAEAQTIILDELETQYGGQAQAAAKLGKAGLQQLANDFRNTREVLGELVNTLIGDFTPTLKGANAAARNFFQNIDIDVVRALIEATIRLVKAFLIWKAATIGLTLVQTGFRVATLAAAAAQAVFTGNMVRAAAATKLLNKALKTNIFGVLISGLIVGVPLLIKFVRGMGEAKDEIDGLTDSVVEEITQLRILERVFVDTTKAEGDTTKATKDLADAVPELNKVLKENGKITREEVITALERYIELLKLAGQAQQLESKIVENSLKLRSDQIENVTLLQIGLFKLARPLQFFTQEEAKQAIISERRNKLLTEEATLTEELIAIKIELNKPSVEPAPVVDLKETKKLTDAEIKELERLAAAAAKLLEKTFVERQKTLLSERDFEEQELIRKFDRLDEEARATGASAKELEEIQISRLDALASLENDFNTKAKDAAQDIADELVDIQDKKFRKIFDLSVEAVKLREEDLADQEEAAKESDRIFKESQQRKTDIAIAAGQQLAEATANIFEILNKADGEFTEDTLTRREELNAALALLAIQSARQAVAIAAPIILANQVAQGGFIGIATAAVLIGIVTGALIAAENKIKANLYEGTEFLTGARGKDQIPANLNYGERVVDTNTNKKLKGIKNKELPEAVALFKMIRTGNGIDLSALMSLQALTTANKSIGSFDMEKIIVKDNFTDKRIVKGLKNVSDRLDALSQQDALMRTPISRFQSPRA